MTAPWLDLLRGAVAASSMTAVAARLGISRTAVSLVLAGKYGAKVDRIAAKVLDVLGESVDCPAKGAVIAKSECNELRSRKAPMHNPIAMQTWRACQRCPHNPSCHAKEAPDARR